MPAQSSTAHVAEVGRVCSRNVITIAPGEDIVAAARLMRTCHIGFLVVCEPTAAGQNRRVIGVLTDRDIVVAVVARDATPQSLKVVDVMTRNPLMVAEDCPLDAALGFMRDAGVRRVPVTGAKEDLVGVMSLDDVVAQMAQQLTSVAAAYRGELRAERVARP